MVELPPQNRFVFTERRMRELPRPLDRAVYLDAELPGLQVRITANGTRTFFIRFRARGAATSERFTLGHWPTMNVIAARTAAREKLGKVALAENPAESLRSLRNEPLLGALAELYFKDRAKAGKRSVEAMRAQWERWVGTLPYAPPKKHGRARVKPPEAVDWSNRRPSEITRESIDALHGRISESGGAFVANRVVDLLRAIFGFAVRKGLATDNPAMYATHAPEVPRSRFLQSHELQAFDDAVGAERQPWRDYFFVLLYVGYRRQAVAAMKWEDLDLRAGTWHVPGALAKNGEAIVLSVAGKARTVLRARAKAPLHATWVFPGEGKAGHITQPNKAWRRVCKRAGLPDLRMHDLRRSLGSWLAMSGQSLPAIGRALGHKDPRSTQVYAHLQADAVRAAVDRAHTAMKEAAKKSNVLRLRQ
jgi:integrase